jgi:rubredoxin
MRIADTRRCGNVALAGMTECPECGFVYEDLPLDTVAPSMRAFARSYREAMDGIDQAVASERPEPTVWSALEYACHIRDVLLVQRDRVVLAHVVECPQPVPMSRDERVAICRYDAQSMADVLDQLAMACELCALVFEGLDDDALAREIIYNFPTPVVRDLGWMGRHTVHEGVHHLKDVHDALAAVSRSVVRR